MLSTAHSVQSHEVSPTFGSSRHGVHAAFPGRFERLGKQKQVSYGNTTGKGSKDKGPFVIRERWDIN